MSENKMGTKKIPALILTMSLPVIVSMLAQALYNVVDRIFVGQVGEDAITALSLAFPIQLIVIAAFVGLTTGVSSSVSRKLGEKDKETAIQIGEHGFLIALVLFIVVVIIGLFIGESYFGSFTENKTIMSYASTYTKIVMFCSFGIIFGHAANGILQGSGDMIKPMIAQMTGVVINIILDPIMILGLFGFPAMGVKGAALATVTAQIISMILILFFLFRPGHTFKPNLKSFRFDWKIIGHIMAVGVPTTIMQALAAFMLTTFNLILAIFSDSAIAVMGIYFGVQSMVFMPVFGLAIGTMPVIGYNFGAKNRSRMSQAIKFSTTVAVCFMTLCFVGFQIFAPNLMAMFNPSQEMMSIGVVAFRRISWIFPLVGMTIIFSTSFQAFGKAYYSLIISAVRMVVILLPAAWLLSRLGDVDLVWYAFIIAEVVGMTVTLFLFTNVYRGVTKGMSLDQ